MKTQKEYLEFIQKILFGVLLIGFLVFTTFAQGKNSTVLWDTSKISQTLGNGIASPTEVKFRVTKTLTSVNISPVPELQNFIRVEPSDFIVLQPNTEYTITISYSLPEQAVEGIYDGTIHLRSGARTIPQPLKAQVIVDYGENIPSSSVKTISHNSLQLISGADPTGNGLYFSQTNLELSQLTPGVILALPPAPSIPNGFFGRVTNVSTINNQLFVATIPASLSEAFMRASVNIDRDLTEEDLTSGMALDENVFVQEKKLKNSFRLSPVEEGFSIRLEDYVMYQAGAAKLAVDGNITVNPQLHFSFDVDDFRLKQLGFNVKLNQSSNLKLKIQVDSNFLEAEKEVFRNQLKPIVVWVGWVPVVIVPEVAFVARVKGTARAGVEFGVSQTSNVTVGAGFANGNWDSIADFSGSFSANPPTTSVGMNIKGQIGPRFKLLLYGIVGPRADVGPFGELDVDIFRTPLWQIFGGIEANVGVRLQIFDRTIADQEFPGVIQNRRLVAQGGSGSSNQLGTVKVATTINGSPFIGSVNYDIVGPNGNIIGLSVPSETKNLSSGQYTLVYKNGGPPNGVLAGINPSTTQTLTAGGTISFTMNFVTQPFQWLSFVEGNPSLPFDGVIINANDGNIRFWFEFTSIFNANFSLADATDGISVTVFPEPGTVLPTSLQVNYEIIGQPFSSCSGGISRGVSRVSFNGAQGIVTYHSRQNLLNSINSINRFNPLCNATINNIQLHSLVLLNSGSTITTLDAATIGRGPDGFPGTLIP